MFIVKSYNKSSDQFEVIGIFGSKIEGRDCAFIYETELEMRGVKYLRQPVMFKEDDKLVPGILFTIDDSTNDITVGDLVELKCFDGSVIQMTVTEVNDSMIVGQNNEGTHWGNPSDVKLIEKNMNR